MTRGKYPIKLFHFILYQKYYRDRSSCSGSLFQTSTELSKINIWGKNKTKQKPGCLKQQAQTERENK